MSQVKKVFQWTASDAEDVYVTGTFDSWSKSIKLEKSPSGVLEKEVTVPLSEKITYKYFVDGNWKVDPHSPTERDPSGNENNVLTIDDLQKLPVVGTETSASAMSKQEEGKESTVESAAPMPGSTQSATETMENVEAKEESLTPEGPVGEAKEEAETTTSVTEQVKEKILEVAAPVTAAATAATAAVTGLFTGVTNGETSIPGTFPETPAEEKVIDEPSAPSTTMIDEVKKTDDEPVPGAVVPSEPKEQNHDLETVALETGAGAAAAGGFAAALAADKAANTAPSATIMPSDYAAAPEKNESFGILPVPSETAPEGTKPLAKTVYKDEHAPTEIGSLVPEPVKEKTVAPVPASQDFEPVTSESNILSSANVEETVAATDTGAAAAAAATEISHVDQLKEAALKSSEHAAYTAAKALSNDVPTPASLNADAALSGLSSGAGVTAIGTATDQESPETGLSRLVARKEDEDVNVETEAKAAQVEPAIVLDDTKMAKPNVETLGTSGNAAVASTPVKVSVPTEDGVQEVSALGTAIATDGGETSQSVQNELLDSGKGTLPEGALAHLSKSEETKPAEAPVTPKKETTTASTISQKTPVTQSSAAKKDNRASMSPSEAGTEKKKKKGFMHRLKKVFS